MGQWTVKEAGSALRRAILLLAVAAVMTAMMVATAVPASAAGRWCQKGERPQHTGSHAFSCVANGEHPRH